MLLAQGAHPDSCRNDGSTPLWIAAQMGHDHVVRLLLQNGACVDAVRCVQLHRNFNQRLRWNYRSFLCSMQDGATALFKAAHKGFCAVVHELLKFSPNLRLLPVSKTRFFIYYVEWSV